MTKIFLFIIAHALLRAAIDFGRDKRSKIKFFSSGWWITFFISIVATSVIILAMFYFKS